MGINFAKLTDEELAELFSAADKSEKAFKEFYSRHSRGVYAYCLKVLNDRDDAGDVFQEIFITFYNTVKNGKVLQKPTHYLMMIARTRCLNFKRDRLSAHKQDTVSFDEEYMAHTESTAEIVERNEKQAILDKALQSLPDIYREIFVLHLYNGLKSKDIAEILGLDETSVKNKLFRAREKMKDFVALYMN